MSCDIEAINNTLKELGSDMRVKGGELISESIEELFRCIPSYVERKIQEALTKQAS